MVHPLIYTKSFGFALLNKELQIKPEERKYFDVFKKAYEDDYWQKGQGSLLPPAQGSYAGNINAFIEQRFIFRNVIKECVDRAAKAFFGKNPNWKYVSNGEDVVLGPEIEKALGEFWTSNDVMFQLIKAFTSRLLTGRGGIRVYIPAKYKVETETEDAFYSFETIQDALSAIKIEFIPPERSRMLTDDGELLSIIQYKVRKNWETTEMTNQIEFSFVDAYDQTYIGTIEENESSTSENPLQDYIKSSALDLDGKPTFFEISGEPFVTTALYKNNQLLNLALTCTGFSLVDNGFGEVFLTNVEMETKQVRGPDGDMIEQPQRLRRGGGAVQSLVGIRQISEDGTENYMSPGVHFKDPTAISVFKDGKELAYKACLEEAAQLYALISGDATASGESRIQAMKDFYLKISQYKSEVDQLGSWLLTTVLKFAGILSETPIDIQVVYDAKIFIGDVTKEEKASFMEQYKAGVISMETCRVLSGVDDPELERELVLGESEYTIEEVSLDEATRRTALANQLVGLLPERRIRAIAFGYSDQELDDIQMEIFAESEMQFRIMEERQRGVTAEQGEDEQGELNA